MKKLARKLSLNRETLQLLTRQGLKGAAGGLTTACTATRDPTQCAANSGCASCAVCYTDSCGSSDCGAICC
jgi:hypothetical protein